MGSLTKTAFNNIKQINIKDRLKHIPLDIPATLDSIPHETYRSCNPVFTIISRLNIFYRICGHWSCEHHSEILKSLADSLRRLSLDELLPISAILDNFLKILPQNFLTYQRSFRKYKLKDDNLF